MVKGVKGHFRHIHQILKASRLFDTVLSVERNCTTYETEPEDPHESVSRGKPPIRSRRDYSTEIRQFEQTLRQQGYQRIAGIDEAGRGALAGPVVAAAVILPINCRISGVTDSKQLTPKQRARLFDEIYHTATAVGVGRINNKEIDEINILQATMGAMAQAIAQITPSPDYALVDGTHLPEISLPAEAIPKGDTLVHSIAAASIIAKVTRDRLMIEFDEIYPGYGFQNHKGYGTLLHRQAIAQLGPCPIHRRSFKLQ
jgi:ribonuclease HII